VSTREDVVPMARPPTRAGEAASQAQGRTRPCSVCMCVRVCVMA
jgi:hypothetical protein